MLLVAESLAQAISKLQIMPTRLQSNAAMVNWGLLVSMAAERTLNGHEIRETRAKLSSLKFVADVGLDFRPERQ